MDEPITIDTGGRHHFLGVWRSPTDGRCGVFWHAAMGARADAANLIDSTVTIRTDERRSDVAKTDDVRAAAQHALRELGKRHQAIEGHAAAIGAERAKVAAVPPYAGDAAEALVDLELARMLREMGADARLKALAGLVGGAGDDRMVNAILRLPRQLTGVSDEAWRVILSRTIERRHPEAVREFLQLEAAEGTARMVLRRAVEIVTEGSGLDLGELSAFGPGWTGFAPGMPADPGVRAALERKYA